MILQNKVCQENSSSSVVAFSEPWSLQNQVWALPERTGGAWITKPFNNWKKATEKVRAHSQNGVHIQSCEGELAATRSMQEGSVIQQLQHTGEQEKITGWLSRHSFGVSTSLHESTLPTQLADRFNSVLCWWTTHWECRKKCYIHF